VKFKPSHVCSLKVMKAVADGLAGGISLNPEEVAVLVGGGMVVLVGGAVLNTLLVKVGWFNRKGYEVNVRLA